MARQEVIASIPLSGIPLSGPSASPLALPKIPDIMRLSQSVPDGLPHQRLFELLPSIPQFDFEIKKRFNSAHNNPLAVLDSNSDLIQLRKDVLTELAKCSHSQMSIIRDYLDTRNVKDSFSFDLLVAMHATHLGSIASRDIGLLANQIEATDEINKEKNGQLISEFLSCHKPANLLFASIFNFDMALDKSQGISIQGRLTTAVTSLYVQGAEFEPKNGSIALTAKSSVIEAIRGDAIMFNAAMIYEYFSEALKGHGSFIDGKKELVAQFRESEHARNIIMNPNFSKICARTWQQLNECLDLFSKKNIQNGFFAAA